MIQIDEKILSQIFEEKMDKAIEEHLKIIERATFFMTTAEVLSYVGMSRNSFIEHIATDPNFKAQIRLGSKHLYNRKELDSYLDKFFVAVRDQQDGQIKRFKKR